ncbi:hypothetical protein GCM10029992_34310 [Glycomyces albus]
MPERSASFDSMPGKVTASTRWPAASNAGVTLLQEEPSSQSPGIMMISMAPTVDPAPDIPLGFKPALR